MSGSMSVYRVEGKAIQHLRIRRPLWSCRVFCWCLLTVSFFLGSYSHALLSIFNLTIHSELEAAGNTAEKLLFKYGRAFDRDGVRMYNAR